MDQARDRSEISPLGRLAFALASVVRNAPEDRQAEAETLFEWFCAEFDGKHAYPYQGIEKTLNNQAQVQLKELRFRAKSSNHGKHGKHGSKTINQQILVCNVIEFVNFVLY